jgi:hypothetical protein
MITFHNTAQYRRRIYFYVNLGVVKNLLYYSVQLNLNVFGEEIYTLFCENLNDMCFLQKTVRIKYLKILLSAGDY